MSGYNNFSRTRQHDISLLVLQLDDLMTSSDKTKCEVREGRDSTFLVAPLTTTLRHEPKKRMKPIHELERNKKMKSLQRQNISQILTLGNNEIEFVATQKRHCAFCNDNHGVNVCPALKVMGEKGMTYHLSTVNININKSLKDRLRISMPVALVGGKGSCFSATDRRFKHSNFIIHEACLVNGLPCNQMEGLNFCITFLDKFAKNVDSASKIWINGDVMTTLISHTNKKIKYVFDQTTVHKEGWSERNMLSQELSIPNEM